MALSGRFALLVALGVVPVVAAGIQGADDAWLALLGWLVLSLVAGALDLALAASPRRVALTRSLPDRVRLGETVTSELAVQQLGSRTLRAVVRDGWEPSAGVAGPNRTRLTIPSGERRRMSLQLTPWRRGDRRTEEVTIRSAGPLGLWSRQATLAAPGRVRVLPPFHSRAHLPSRLTRLRELDGRTPLLIRGQGTEFDSIREYVRGDDVRSIDWRATARAGTTMLRTWRPERDRHVVIVIDTGRTAAARVGDGVRLDAAMEAALLLAALATRAGDHTHLLMFDRVTRARVTRVDGPALLPALVDAMAPVEPQLIDTDWDAAFAQVRSLTSRPSLVVLLTAQDAPEAARGFLGSLPALSRRAHVLVGTVTDAGQAPGERRDAAAVYRAAAAERGARDAARVAAAIGRAGAEAVADSPESLPPRIADRYLELKATGRL
ncbi:MAG: DUF58 domain-containing protein [Microbacterium sp.]